MTCRFDEQCNRITFMGRVWERPLSEWPSRKLFKSTLNNRLHRNLACVIDKSSRGAKLERAFEELPQAFERLNSP